ncbi:site-specific integrase [Candidatus Uhrbacteria bacterium]|nr:site-specific integrase [Candidatus Uhrbacteria bacterium]
MPARKLKGKWGTDFRFNRKRFRLKSPENSRRGAEAYEVHLKRRLMNGEDVRLLIAKEKVKEKANPTFESFSKEWVRNYVEPNNKPSTRRAKLMILNQHLIPCFGKKLLTEITNAEVERFKAAKRSTHLSPKSINNILSVLSTCIRSAQQWGYVENIIRISWLKVPPQSFDFLTEEETDRLLHSDIGEPWYTMILMALRTGMRHGELIGLDWKDINLAERRITVQQSLVEGVLGSPKSNRIRHIPISEDLAEALARQKRRQGFVFITEDGEPMRSMYTWRGLREVCERIGMRIVRWHAFRHTFASHLTMRGAPIRNVQALMGHSTVQMTERYSHLVPSALHETIALLDQRPRIKFENVGHPAGTGIKNIALEMARIA